MGIVEDIKLFYLNFFLWSYSVMVAHWTSAICDGRETLKHIRENPIIKVQILIVPFSVIQTEKIVSH